MPSLFLSHALPQMRQLLVEARGAAVPLTSGSVCFVLFDSLFLKKLSDIGRCSPAQWSSKSCGLGSATKCMVLSSLVEGKKVELRLAFQSVILEQDETTRQRLKFETVAICVNVSCLYSCHPLPSLHNLASLASTVVQLQLLGLLSSVQILL